MNQTWERAFIARLSKAMPERSVEAKGISDSKSFSDISIKFEPKSEKYLVIQS
jgi:hypothetical protein